MEDGRILPNITKQSRNREGTPPIIINNNINNEGTVFFENNIHFRLVNNSNKKYLGKDAVRNYT